MQHARNDTATNTSIDLSPELPSNFHSTTCWFNPAQFIDVSFSSFCQNRNFQSAHLKNTVRFPKSEYSISLTFISDPFRSQFYRENLNFDITAKFMKFAPKNTTKIRFVSVVLTDWFCLLNCASNCDVSLKTCCSKSS